MRLSKELKAFAVLEWLDLQPQTMQQLMRMTGFNRAQVRQALDWLRDYDPNCLVSYRDGMTWYYKLAEDADEVRLYVHGRSKTLYRMALRLERMVTMAVQKWPEDRTLKVMARHLTRMREDVDDIREDVQENGAA